LEFGHCDKQKEANSNEDLDTIMLETIDEVLSLLCESLKVEVFFYLSKDFGINRKEVPNNLAGFSNAFGNPLGERDSFLKYILLKKLDTKIKAVQNWRETNSVVPDLEFESLVKVKERRIQQTMEICKMETLLTDGEKKFLT
jgi:hypothetical protein